MQRIAFLPALLLLLVPAVGAASPNENATVLELDGAVTALALGEDAGWIAAGMADPVGRRDIDPLTQTIGPVDVEVWTWWNHLGSQLRSNDVDRAECSTPGNIDPCQTNVVDMAMSADGRSLVVAGVDEGDQVSTLLFIDANGGIKDSKTLGSTSLVAPAARLVRAIDMTPDGKHIVAAVHIPGVGTGAGTTELRRYFWDHTAETVTETGSVLTGIPGRPEDVSISPNGERVSIAAGTHVRVSNANAFASKGISGQAHSVDMSAETTKYWSVAAFDGGEVALYSTKSETGGLTAEFSQRPVNNLVQTDAAIAPHGKWFAAGAADGSVRLYLNPIAVQTVAPMIGIQKELGGPVQDMAFSGDGRYLVVSAGDSVHFFRTDEGVFERYWSVTHTLDQGQDVRHVAINADGTLVVAAAGNKIYQYTELKAYDITLPATTVRVSPTNQVSAELKYNNLGNREATVELTATAPKDWSVIFEKTTLSVAPGAEQPFRMTVVAPSTALAGDADISVHFKVNGEDKGSQALVVKVLQEQIWGMERVSSEVLSMDPGRTASFAVNITNLGNALDSTQILVDVDKEGWLVAVDPGELELAPGVTSLATVAVTAPANAQELDKAEITLRLSADEDATTSFEALVGADFGVQFAILTPEDPTMFPGNRTTIRLSISNPGNALDSYRIETAGVPAGWTIRFPDDKNPHTVFSLARGASWEIPVDITAAEDAEPGNYQLAFRATSLGDTTQSSIAKTVLVVEEAPPEDDDKKSPGFEVVALIALVGAIAVLARKR